MRPRKPVRVAGCSSRLHRPILAFLVVCQLWPRVPPLLMFSPDDTPFDEATTQPKSQALPANRPSGGISRAALFDGHPIDLSRDPTIRPSPRATPGQCTVDGLTPYCRAIVRQIPCAAPSPGRLRTSTCPSSRPRGAGQSAGVSGWPLRRGRPQAPGLSAS